MQPTAWQSPHGRPLPGPGGRTLVMGVLNVTPDSFSDGGQLPSAQAVVDCAGAMLAAGADVLDVGGESTRPGAAPVSVAEECDRVLPALTALRRAFTAAAISVDTYKPAVAEAGVRAGADIVNDIWGGLHGFTADQRRRGIEAMERGGTASLPRSPMAEAVAALNCPVILMHNRPDRDYGDFWTDLLLDLRLSLAVAGAAGVPGHQLWLDPGFGFAKEPRHNLEVLRHLDRIVALGHPVLLGTSRKSTIGRVLGTPVNDRLDGTGATLVWGIQQGCQMVRVHDVAPMLRFVRMADAIKAGLAWNP
ncbi:MAG: dihydropteroate synthase [Opitutaceae bacterium]|nr:dihydropteroate synthase [Opitutaceae bacterium]